MWCAVILQALEDATSDLKQTKPRDRQDARDWFLKAGKDFRDVCSLAGMDHECVSVEAKRKIEDAIAGEGVPRHRPGRTRFLTHNGETLKIAEWSRRLGIATVTINYRLRIGQSIEQALSPRRGRQERRFEYDGKSLTLKEWSAIIGISARTIRNRLSIGWSLERALMTRVEDGKKERFRRTQSFATNNNRARRIVRRPATSSAPIYTCAGESLTMKQWAKRLGVNVNALHQRMSKGWSLEQTLTTPAKRAGKPSLYSAIAPAPTSSEAMQPPSLMTHDALHRGRGCLETSANALGAGEGPTLKICSK